MRPIFIFLIALLGCGDTGQPRVRYSAEVLSAPAASLSVGAWTVTMQTASVAFGPLYLCAAASGSATLCETAVGELVAVHRLDLLVDRQALGDVRGLEGEVRSASFDYGIHWLLTEEGPRAAPEAPGGHSAVFTGTAVRGSESLRFEANIDVVASYQGQRAVPSIAASGLVDETTTGLEIAFDVGRWIGALDFDDVAALPGDPKRIAPGDDLHNALVLAMGVNAPPELHWLPER
jgi:hypothetical protein